MARIGELIGPNGEVMHPKTSASVVYLEDGRSVEQVLSDDIDYGNVVFQNNSYKFDSDVEDDFAKTVVIKGQTYQNILPEPSTHILSNNKEMFQVNENLDSIVKIVDDVSKYAILSGQTLVNGLTNPRRGGNIDYATVVSPTHIILNHGTNDTEEKTSVRYDWFGGKMGDGVDYTLDLWILKNTMHRKTDPNATIGKFNFNSYNNGFYSIPANTLGHITWEVTTSTSNTGGGPYIETFTTCEGELEVKFVIREGRNLEPLTDHFEGMIDCKMPALKTVGKNLYSYGDIVRNGGSSRNIWETGVVVEPGETVTLSCNGTTTGNDKRIQLIISSERSQLTVGEIASGLKAAAASLSGGPVTITLKNDKGIKGYCFIRMVEGRADYSVTDIQVEKSSSSTPYEPCKFNIVKPLEEIVLRSLPGGVKDTLNLNTGEYVQRIGTYTFDGSESWSLAPSDGGETCTYFQTYAIGSKVKMGNTPLQCDKFIWRNNLFPNTEFIKVGSGTTNGNVYLNVLSSRLSSADVDGLKQWLSKNPVTIQYELATPIFKTVDLSTSGNCDKAVFNGSEDWKLNSAFFSEHIIEFMIQQNNNGLIACDEFPVTSSSNSERIARSNNTIYIRIFKKKLATLDADGFKKFLQKKPVTLWYQTASQQDDTQVKQPIFFNEGHIIQLSEADNSAIPTLSYQAKTSNSYVMNLIKAGQWTIKSDSCSGVMYIGSRDLFFGLHSTNRTIELTQSQIDSLPSNLWFFNETFENGMVLSGDLTAKSIPHFKGIKSSFEECNQIEILSTGKNLFDGKFEMGYITADGRYGNSIYAIRTVNYIKVKPGTKYRVKINEYAEGSNLYIHEYDSNKKVIKEVCTSIGFTSSSETHYIKINTHDNEGKALTVDATMQVEEGDNVSFYEPYKSSIAKVSLPSPLRSLPNGICDELIIDRVEGKATLIQRVGHDIINREFSKDGGNWGNNRDYEPCWGFHCGHYVQGSFKFNDSNTMSDKLPIKAMTVKEEPLMGYYQSNPHIALRAEEVCVMNMALNWLDRNPIDFYYQLERPIITEMELSGFPYIYKDGSVCLNSEIDPTVGIEYSINQGQRITCQVETLQRHEKQFSKLEQYFADLVYSDYNFALLRLNEELH